VSSEVPEVISAEDEVAETVIADVDATVVIVVLIILNQKQCLTMC
jgi:hypothetical protein